jgi:hypothetical protein
MTAIFSRWQRGDQYDWLSGYLAARGVSGITRALMAIISTSLVLCLIALLFSSDGPRGAGAIAMTWAAVAGGVGSALLWVWRWPTRVQSLLFAGTCNTAVALACLAHPNPLAALIGCIAFATFGAYIAFFHTTQFVLYNFAVAAAVGLYEAVRSTSRCRWPFAFWSVPWPVIYYARIATRSPDCSTDGRSSTTRWG